MMSQMRARLRWYVKKAARIGLAATSWGTGMLALRRCLYGEGQVRVLMYHRFRSSPYDPFSISVGAFEHQMAWLAEHGLAISLEEFGAFLSGQRRLLRDAVLVTVDDGFRDLWQEAVPILKRYKIPAVAFITSSDVAAASGDGEEGEQRLCWEEICNLPEYGVAVGSHARDHVSLATLSRNQVFFQADQFRRDIEAHLQMPVVAFAYPYGTWADYNDMTEEVLDNAGYTYVFTAQHGAVTPGTEPNRLPRIKVEGGEGLWVFKLLVHGGLDAWGWIDRFAWRWQKSVR
ncbi:polysaccharide deacetylase family protein [Candidatus Entotheonella palauensis]|uniref:polysaccharide deacetylase family protein n=1 Tax=Candidatus Entotheonella palauensis TaxID=93172 RepID=UPI000B7FD627|nr:polysaccharide deacetylase family protein [Candidatus Entotheonella palauensis]